MNDSKFLQPPMTQRVALTGALEKPPLLRRSLVLMKPITWFGPMWAFLCGTIASGATQWSLSAGGRIFLGMILAGPVLCGISQVMNDYYDRHIDAINEPQRLIPSGRVSTRQVWTTIGVLLLVGIGLGLYLGMGVSLLATLGMVLAVLYSAQPFRAKRNGWIGNLLVAISYEGLAWMAGHLAFASLTGASVLVALLYSLGSHGIMSINDYKSIAGDKISGIKTIPVLYGTRRAAWLIVITMNAAQLGVIAAFLVWGNWLVALIITAIVMLQFPTQRNFIRDPEGRFLQFSAIGVSFFVWGMMAAAIGLRYVN